MRRVEFDRVICLATYMEKHNRLCYRTSHHCQIRLSSGMTGFTTITHLKCGRKEREEGVQNEVVLRLPYELRTLDKTCSPSLPTTAQATSSRQSRPVIYHTKGDGVTVKMTVTADKNDEEERG